MGEETDKLATHAVSYTLSVIENWFAFPAFAFLLMFAGIAFVATAYENDLIMSFTMLFADDSGVVSLHVDNNNIWSVMLISSLFYSILVAIVQIILKKLGFEIRLGIEKKIISFLTIIVIVATYTYFRMMYMDSDFDYLGVGFVWLIFTVLTIFFGSLSLFASYLVDKFRKKYLIEQEIHIKN